MERNLNAIANSKAFFNQVFNCDKMKTLVAEKNKSNFSQRFSDWLKAHTRNTKEKVWMDIESYNAG